MLLKGEVTLPGDVYKLDGWSPGQMSSPFQIVVFGIQTDCM